MFLTIISRYSDTFLIHDLFQALLQENFVVRETIVQENGKVLPNLDIDESKIQLAGIVEFYEMKHSRPLRLKKKLYEFYTAPITKFWANSVCLDSAHQRFEV